MLSRDAAIKGRFRRCSHLRVCIISKRIVVRLCIDSKLAVLEADGGEGHGEVVVLPGLLDPQGPDVGQLFSSKNYIVVVASRVAW